MLQPVSRAFKKLLEITLRKAQERYAERRFKQLSQHILPLHAAPLTNNSSVHAHCSYLASG